MKSILVTALLLLKLQGLPPLVGPLIPDSNGAVTGVVRRGDSGQPLNGAEVAVVAEGETLEQVKALRATTDVNGRFTIKNVAPGVHALVVQSEGYFGPTAEADASPRATQDIYVVEGQQTDVGVVKLIAGSTISGRMYGLDGQPAAAATVQALKASYSRGRLTFTPVKSVRTDDRGEYRLFWLPPGEYYIRGQYRSRSDAVADRYGRVFFPGILEEDAAPPVGVRSGAEVSGIDFRVPTTPDSGVTIKGQVVGGEDETDLRVSSVYLIPRDRRVVLIGDDADMFTNSAVDASSGRFEIRNVPPGEYNLSAIVGDGKSIRAVSVLVDVAKANIEGIVTKLEPAFDLSGRVTLDGSAPGNSVLRSSLQLVPLDLPPIAAPPGINPNSQTGEFVVRNLIPGKYALHLSSAFRTPDIYVADLKRGDVSVFDVGVTIGGEPQEPLEIVLKSKGGAVSGMVSDTTRLHAFPHATVVLLPELSRRQNFALHQHVVTAENGRFSFTGIPPGDYKLFAWASLTAGAWGNALFLQRFESRGTPLTITAGTAQTVPLTVIP